MKKNPRNKAFTLLEISIVMLIVGLVALGISQGSGIYYEYNLKTARSLTKSSAVASFPGLVLWLDATAENSLTNTSNSSKVEDSDTVKTWIDQNPQVEAAARFTFTQKASGEGPKYFEKGINNLPSLYFDSNITTGNGLYTAYSPILNPQQFTFFIVTTPVENTGDWGAVIMSRDNSNTVTSSKGYNVYKRNNSAYFVFWWGNGTGWDTVSDVATLSYGSPYITSGMRYGTLSGGTSGYWRNGVLSNIGVSPFSPNDDPAGINRQFTIGYNAGVSGGTEVYFYDGYISEIIIYNRSLKDYERKSIESYLLQKYKIK